MGTNARERSCLTHEQNRENTCITRIDAEKDNTKAEFVIDGPPSKNNVVSPDTRANSAIILFKSRPQSLRKLL